MFASCRRSIRPSSSEIGYCLISIESDSSLKEFFVGEKTLSKEEMIMSKEERRMSKEERRMFKEERMSVEECGGLFVRAQDRLLTGHSKKPLGEGVGEHQDVGESIFPFVGKSNREA
jgi:hypothetical protein